MMGPKTTAHREQQSAVTSHFRIFDEIPRDKNGGPYIIFCDICNTNPYFVAQAKHGVVHHRSVASHWPLPSRCEICGRSFDASAEEIISSIRSDIRRFICTVCHKEFIRSTEMLAHAFHHTKKKPLQCDRCDRRFTGKRMLMIHVQSRHPQAVEAAKKGDVVRTGVFFFL
jgi:uncharacterized Zn-finger protein